MNANKKVEIGVRSTDLDSGKKNLLTPFRNYHITRGGVCQHPRPLADVVRPMIETARRIGNERLVMALVALADRDK